MDGGIGQAAGQLLEEMKQAQADLQQQQETKKTEGPNEAFNNAMHQAEGVHSSPEALRAGQVETAGKAQNVLMQARVHASELSTHVGQAHKSESSHMAKMLDGLLQGQDKMGEIMDTAMSGKQLSPPELLGMQAAVFRYTQELELVGKVIDKAVSGVKQVLNTQV